jgi:hypothetical protein
MIDYYMVDGVAKGILAWMLFVSTLVGLMVKSASTFYRFGPQEDLVVLGIFINTNIKYAAVSLFCIANSFIRSVESDVLHAWLINTVQNKDVPKSENVRQIAYQVSIIHSMYYWWDWFIYMNILLAQLDLFLMEMTSSIITSIITTRMYLQHEPMFQLLT